MYTLRHFYKPGKKAEIKFTTAQGLEDYLDELSSVYDLKEITHFDDSEIYEFATTYTVDLVTDPSAVRRKRELREEDSKIDMLPIVPEPPKPVIPTISRIPKIPPKPVIPTISRIPKIPPKPVIPDYKSRIPKIPPKPVFQHD